MQNSTRPLIRDIFPYLVRKQIYSTNPEYKKIFDWLDTFCKNKYIYFNGVFRFVHERDSKKFILKYSYD
jgi:hypothetical protein